MSIQLSATSIVMACGSGRLFLPAASLAITDLINRTAAVPVRNRTATAEPKNNTVIATDGDD
jgi:hypothetical protein